jgi:hypothetical protein
MSDVELIDLGNATAETKQAVGYEELDNEFIYGPKSLD